MKNFWEKLNHCHKGGARKPIYALAPMAGITDSAFRQICKKFGADVVYSEMASATALVYQPQKTLRMLQSNKKESPYVIQLFGSNPKHFAIATKLLANKKEISKLPRPRPAKRGGQIPNYQLPQGIDINFGCPVKKVQKQGAGAVLMNRLKLSREIIKSVIDNTDLPVSVKTRSKVGGVDALKFLDNVRDLDIKAVMIHARTLRQGFSGPVDTEIIKKARDYFPGIILANGGIYSYDDAVKILEATKADGIGIARGSLGRPWIFKAVRTGQSIDRSRRPIFREALRHARLAYKLNGEQGIVEMRKHLCWYVAGLPGARKMRKEFVQVNNLKDIENIIKAYF